MRSMRHLFCLASLVVSLATVLHDGAEIQKLYYCLLAITQPHKLAKFVSPRMTWLKTRAWTVMLLHARRVSMAIQYHMTILKCPPKLRRTGKKKSTAHVHWEVDARYSGLAQVVNFPMISQACQTKTPTNTRPVLLSDTTPLEMPGKTCKCAFAKMLLGGRATHNVVCLPNHVCS